jgi:hypothetical protein
MGGIVLSTLSGEWCAERSCIGGRARRSEGGEPGAECVDARFDRASGFLRGGGVFMKLATILLSLLMVLATVMPVVAEEKEKADGPEYDQTRALLNCTNAIPIQCGVPVNGTNAGIASLVTLYSGCGWNEKGGEVVYTLTLPGPSNWTFTATLSPVTNDPDIFILSACDEATNIGVPACGNTYQTVTNVPAGTYYIVVDQYGSTTPVNPATWTLTVTCTELVPPCCPFPETCHFIDFNQSPNNWASLVCGVGPVPWAWGVATGIPTMACDAVPVTNVLVTGLAGNYPISTGEAAVVGPFKVFPGCTCLEICHYYYTEQGYDGGNVRISTDGGITWTRIAPTSGYPGTISTAWQAQCVIGEPAFTGNSTTFVRSCFDISAYVDQNILVGFFFGSDSSLSYRGWAIKWLRIGGTDISPIEGKSWGSIKALYR